METNSNGTWLIDSFFVSQDGARRGWKLSQPFSRDGSWSILRILEGFDSPEGVLFSGGDAIQVILIGFERTRIALEESGCNFKFEGREPLYCALPKLVPFEYGSDVANRVERYIEGEGELWNRLVEHRRNVSIDTVANRRAYTELVELVRKLSMTEEDVFRLAFLVKIAKRLFDLE